MSKVGLKPIAWTFAQRSEFDSFEDLTRESFSEARSLIMTISYSFGRGAPGTCFSVRAIGYSHVLASGKGSRLFCKRPVEGNGNEGRID